MLETNEWGLADLSRAVLVFVSMEVRPLVLPRFCQGIC